MCEFDHPESEAVFTHKFFCTYCDRGPNHSRDKRETIAIESVLHASSTVPGPGRAAEGGGKGRVLVRYPYLSDGSRCQPHA